MCGPRRSALSLLLSRGERPQGLLLPSALKPRRLRLGPIPQSVSASLPLLAPRPSPELVSGGGGVKVALGRRTRLLDSACLLRGRQLKMPPHFIQAPCVRLQPSLVLLTQAVS